jgi:hypothetical protein
VAFSAFTNIGPIMALAIGENNSSKGSSITSAVSLAVCHSLQQCCVLSATTHFPRAVCLHYTGARPS